MPFKIYFIDSEKKKRKFIGSFLLLKTIFYHFISLGIFALSHEEQIMCSNCTELIQDNDVYQGQLFLS